MFIIIFVLGNDKCHCHEYGITQMRFKTGISDITNEKNRLVCPIMDCQMEMCVLCNKIFHGGKCEQTSDEQTMAVLQSSIEKGIIKLCPNQRCGVPTEKRDGCNHMICVKCRVNWCWGCQTVPVDAGMHNYSH